MSIGDAMATPELDGVALRSYRRVGRSLQATKSFNVGDVVLADTPVLEWNADVVAVQWPCGLTSSSLLQGRSPPTPAKAAGDSDDEQQQATTRLAVPSFFVAAAAAYCSEDVSSSTRRCILNMHVPDLPIGIALLDASLFCERLSSALACSLRDEADPGAKTFFSPSALLHVMLAAKVNAHRGPGGTWRMYPNASKLAHSCDPNCAYIPQSGSFVAIRSIAAGSLISFSYLGGPPLMFPAEMRQERLLQSHLFICQCSRCRGRDAARTFPCFECNQGSLSRCTSPMIDADEDLSPESFAWRCDTCLHTRPDSDPQLVAYKQAEEHLWTKTLCSAGEPNHPYRLGELGECLAALLCVDVDGGPDAGSCARGSVGSVRLGRRCWLYGLTMMHLGRYFYTIGKASGHVGTLGLSVQCWSLSVAVHLEVTAATVPLSMLTVHALTHLSEVYRLLAVVRGMEHLPEHEEAANMCSHAVRMLGRVFTSKLVPRRLGESSRLVLERMSTEVMQVAVAMRSGEGGERFRMEAKKLQFLAFLLTELKEWGRCGHIDEPEIHFILSDDEASAIENEVLSRLTSR